MCLFVVSVFFTPGLTKLDKNIKKNSDERGFGNKLVDNYVFI